MPECVLALDVGGTSVKLALIGPDGCPLPGTTNQQDFNADGTRDEILEAFYLSALHGMHLASDVGYSLAGCGIAFPGPFDYTVGISCMTHKMKGIQGVPLTPVLRKALGNIQVRYLHDSTAYLLGEAFSGAAEGAASPACVMLGTGFGFTYMHNGHVQVGFDQRPHIILWNAPFRDGTVEDYVSRRAIRERYAKAAGLDTSPDVKQIASMARAGDLSALLAFRITGELLADILHPVLLDLNCELLVVGGQIARSADLFLKDVQAGLPMPVRVAAHLDDAALRGAARYCVMPHRTCVEEVVR